MKSEKSFIAISQTLNWAAEAIAEFEEISGLFFDGINHEFFLDVHPKTGYQCLKVRVDFKPIPDRAVRKGTEAIRNIKDSFDQCMFAARNIIDRPRNSTVFFPWAQTPDDLKKRLLEPKFPDKLKPSIRTIEPYPRGNGYSGGDDIIRALAQIGGKAKHTIHLGVSPNLTRIFYPGLVRISPGPWDGTMRIGYPSWDSSKNELMLVVIPPGFEVNRETEAELHFEICFDEAPPLKGIALIHAAKHFLKSGHTFFDATKNICRQHLGD